jgi:hypothetical protein
MAKTVTSPPIRKTDATAIFVQMLSLTIETRKSESAMICEDPAPGSLSSFWE